MMVFIEPEQVFNQRRAQPPVYQQQVISGQPVQTVGNSAGRRLHTEFWTELALRTVREHGGAPMPITTLANALAKWGNFTSRDDREEHKLRSFRLIGNLIRNGLLCRVSRRFVIVAVRSN